MLSESDLQKEADIEIKPQENTGRFDTQPQEPGTPQSNRPNQSFRIQKKTKSSQLFSPQAQYLIQSKNEKKDAETNFQSLRCRVSQLKLQEEKNMKQIRQTKRRTMSIIQGKTRAYMEKQLQQINNMKIQQMEEEKAQQAREQREQERRATDLRKNYLEQKRLQEIQFQKQMKKQIRESKDQRLQEINYQNLDLYNQVKDHQIRLTDRKKKIEDIKVKMAEQNYRERIEKQIKEAMNAQMQLELIEQQEQIALEQLHHTQTLQRSALQEIKSIIKVPTKSSTHVMKTFLVK